ncbi:hypothetical protein [Promicromonospora soli]|nr:hypothetical protein [Promicromonospora soli]
MASAPALSRSRSRASPREFAAFTVPTAMPSSRATSASGRSSPVSS